MGLLSKIKQALKPKENKKKKTIVNSGKQLYNRKQKTLL